jgi:hypothetical protein
VTEKAKITPQSRSRRFCIAPMMESVSQRRNALRFKLLASLVWAPVRTVRRTALERVQMERSDNSAYRMARSLANNADIASSIHLRYRGKGGLRIIVVTSAYGPSYHSSRRTILAAFGATADIVGF